MHPQPLQRGLVAVKFGQGAAFLLQQQKRLAGNAGFVVNPHTQPFCACYGAQLLQRVLGYERGGHLQHPQHAAQFRYGPCKAAIDADARDGASPGIHGPCAQGLRAAVQVVCGLLGRHRGAVHLFQRGELLGLRFSAAGGGAVICCCLHFSPFRHVDLCRGVNCKIGVRNPVKPGKLSDSLS